MHETAEDLAALQRVLEESHAGAGGHLRGILQEEHRLTAEEVVELLPGVQVLVLATVSKDCAPVTGGVDGLFFRGAFHFGSSPESVRARHLARNPAVSASHLRGEELAIVVHGTAEPVDPWADDAFRRYLIEVYPDWESWYPEPGGAVYWQIAPRRMFAARLPGA